MNRLPSQFDQMKIAKTIIDVLPPGKNCWLVGGALRDDILGVKPHDFDLACNFDPTDLARTCGSRLGGTFILLDPVRHQSRVVFSFEGERCTLDFAPLRASSLEKDLSLRDFTCNALACELREPDSLIDPLGGEQDLMGGILRTCSECVLRDDPLRIVKGIRHAVELNMALHESVCRQMYNHRHLLAGIAKERITAELGRIFSHPQFFVGASIIDRFDLLDHLSGANDYSIDVAGLNHALSAEKRFADSLLFDGFSKNIEENWPIFALVRLCRGVVGSNPENSRRPFSFLKQSNKAVSITHMLLSLSQLEVPPALVLDTSRKRALWLDQFRPSPQAAALFMASLEQFSRFDLVSCLSDWRTLQVEGRVPDLISPKVLIETWGVSPGENLGHGLETLRTDEISGKISSLFNEEELVRAYFKKN